MFKPTYSLLSRKKLAFSVLFRLRPSANKSALVRPIQVRITLAGVEDAGFSTGLSIDSNLWDQAGQRVIGRSDHAQTVMRGLTAIKARLESVWQQQDADFRKGLRTAPTCATVKAAYHTPVLPKESVPGGVLLSDCVLAYTAYLRSIQHTREGLSDKTIVNVERAAAYLAAYCCDTGQDEPTAVGVTPFWMDSFRRYLYGRGGISRKASLLKPGTAWKIVNDVQRSVAHLHRSGQPFVNPLVGVSHPIGPGKEVYFLGPNEYGKLFTDEGRTAIIAASSKGEGKLLSCYWWVRLMCLTGMDYPDAVRYATNPAQYEVEGRGGKKIVIRRGKRPFNECHIPYDERITTLLLEGLPIALSTRVAHYYTVKIGKAIGFDKRLTAKICRKSAGAAFHLNDISIDGVSNILGHSNPNTTVKHYLSITGHVVDRDMVRRNEKQIGFAGKGVSRV